jgi:hypothetical protein
MVACPRGYRNLKKFVIQYASGFFCSTLKAYSACFEKRFFEKLNFFYLVKSFNIKRKHHLSRALEAFLSKRILIQKNCKKPSCNICVRVFYTSKHKLYILNLYLYTCNCLLQPFSSILCSLCGQLYIADIIM